MGQTGTMNVDPAGETGEEAEWQDLATNRPGQAAREKAVELKRAAPVKTFIARALNVHTDERGFESGPTVKRKWGDAYVPLVRDGMSSMPCPWARRTATSTTS